MLIDSSEFSFVEQPDKLVIGSNETIAKVLFNDNLCTVECCNCGNSITLTEQEFGSFWKNPICPKCNYKFVVYRPLF